MVEPEVLALQSVEAMNPDDRESVLAHSFPLWARRYPYLPQLKGPPDFKDHPWFNEMYEWGGRDLVVRKAPQVGATTFAFLFCLHGARYHWPLGFAYFLPHGSGMGDLVREKVDPIIYWTPTLAKFSERGVDNLGMKRIGRSFGYFRGLDSAQNRKSISADVTIYDERDDMEELHIDEAMERMSSSAIRRTIRLSVPSVPKHGIDKDFEGSSQAYWTMRCEGCRREWTVEESWPDCVAGQEGQHKLVCPKCGKDADVRDGRWLHRKPSSDVQGYTMSAMLNPKVDLNRMMRRWGVAKKRHLFTRTGLGMPARDLGGRRLNAADVLAKCGTKTNAKSDPGPCFMGADVGGSTRTSPCVIGKWDGKRPVIVAVFPWNTWSDLTAAMKDFNVERAVVDGQPEVNSAPKWARAQRGKAFCAYYTLTRGSDPKWDEGLSRVSLDRIGSLDDSYDPLYDGGVGLELPQEDEDVRRLANECGNLVRVEETLFNGNVKVDWKDEGDDHSRHAFNYLWAAMNVKRKTAKVVVL